MSLAIITGARLPASGLSFASRKRMLATLDTELTDAEFAPLLVHDFLRKERLLSGSLSRLIEQRGTASLTGEAVDALQYLHARATLAAACGTTIALTRTGSWSGVIETNHHVFLDQ